ncbi:MAG: hypothetical protein D6785_06990 [Planctomycetota bacterium]|nr:MAG: hypothetical protein D6785_06990 [Planctomycetota bacterium]
MYLFTIFLVSMYRAPITRRNSMTDLRLNSSLNSLVLDAQNAVNVHKKLKDFKVSMAIKMERFS